MGILNVLPPDAKRRQLERQRMFKNEPKPEKCKHCGSGEIEVKSRLDSFGGEALVMCKNCGVMVSRKCITEESARRKALDAWNRVAKTERWTTQQEQRLRDLSKTMTANEIAAELGKTSSAIWNKMKRLGLPLKRYGGRAQLRTWSRQEREIMRDYENFSNPELAKMLGRTIHSVEGFAQRNFLMKKNWTADETAKLRELAASTPVKELAVLFQRSDNAVIKQCKREGIEYFTCRAHGNDEQGTLRT